MVAQYDLKKSIDDQFYFNLVAVNNEVSLTSEMYQSRAGAENGACLVREYYSPTMGDAIVGPHHSLDLKTSAEYLSETTRD